MHPARAKLNSFRSGYGGSPLHEEAPNGEYFFAENKTVRGFNMLNITFTVFCIGQS